MLGKKDLDQAWKPAEAGWVTSRWWCRSTKIVRMQVTAADVLHSFACRPSASGSTRSRPSQRDWWFKRCATRGLLRPVLRAVRQRAYSYMPIAIRVVSEGDQPSDCGSKRRRRNSPRPTARQSSPTPGSSRIQRHLRTTEVFTWHMLQPTPIDHGPGTGFKRWFHHSTNHKDIGTLLTRSSLTAGLVGAFLSFTYSPYIYNVSGDHGILHGHAGDDWRVRQLDGAADDRRAGHGLPAHEQHLLLALPASFALLLTSLFMRGPPGSIGFGSGWTL